jgi:glycosyltransferase involved in cell wall biosynthesis
MHEDFIAECLDSMVSQKTSFPFIVLVGVDDGGDNTLDICRSYEKRHPNLVKVVLNEPENVLTVKGRRVGRYNFINILNQAKGKYIARCDGDDYWTDPYKLQKQVDILEACPADIFANRVRLKTRTLLFRNTISPLPDWFFTIAFGDVALSIILGHHGDFCFIDQPLAVYRQTGAGISTVGNERPDYYMQHFFDWIDLWEKGDMFANGEFREEALGTIVFFYQLILVHYKYRFQILFLCIKNILIKSNYPALVRLKVLSLVVKAFYHRN